MTTRVAVFTATTIVVLLLVLVTAYVALAAAAGPPAPVPPPAPTVLTRAQLTTIVRREAKQIADLTARLDRIDQEHSS